MPTRGDIITSNTTTNIDVDDIWNYPIYTRSPLTIHYELDAHLLFSPLFYLFRVITENTESNI